METHLTCSRWLQMIPSAWTCLRTIFGRFSEIWNFWSKFGRLKKLQDFDGDFFSKVTRSAPKFVEGSLGMYNGLLAQQELSSSKTVAVRSIWNLDFWDLAKFLEKVLSIKVEHFLTFSKSHQICSKFCGRVAGHIKKILAPQVFAPAQKLWPWEEKVLSIKVEHFLTFSKSHQICSKLCGREPGHIIKTFAPQVLVSSSKTVAVRSIWNLDFWDLE